MDIGYIAIPEQPLELGLYDTVGNVLLRDQSPAARIGVESKAVGNHVRWKAPILRIPLAVVLVDENGAGQRKVFLAVERIIGEQNPALTAAGKDSQALAARAVTGGHFRVRGMTIAR